MLAQLDTREGYKSPCAIKSRITGQRLLKIVSEHGGGDDLVVVNQRKWR